MNNKYLLPLGIAISLLLSGCGNNSNSSDNNASTQASEEVSQSEISKQLSGKTFYYVGGEEEDDSEKVYTLVFNQELTSLTSTEDAGAKAITLEGNQLNLPENEAMSLKEVSDDYLLMNYLENSEISDTFRLYFDKSKAEAYFASLSNILSSLIVGTTQYTINTNSALSDKVIKSDGVFTEKITLANAKKFDTIGMYSIEKNVITFTRDTGIVIVATYEEHNAEYITLEASLNGKEAFKTYWFLTAEARDSKGVKLIEK